MMENKGARWGRLVVVMALAAGPLHAEEGAIVGTPTQPHSTPTAGSEAQAPLQTITVSDDVPVPEQDDKRTASKNRLVEEVVVTAQKREERLQDVPIAIQAFSADSLAARGVTDTRKLAESVPSLNFTVVAGFNNIYMRGIGTDSFVPSADPSVATYVDGVYIPGAQGTINSLGNIERVEVLKGPQGTLFGRNSTGGAINVITEEPGNIFKGSVEGELGNYNRRSIKASATIPLTDWFSFSAAGQVSGSDNYYTSEAYDISPDRLETYRIKANIRPVDGLTLSVTDYRSSFNSLRGVVGNVTDSSVLLGAAIVPRPDSLTINSDYEAFSRPEQHVTYGTLMYETPWFDTKLLASDVDVVTRAAGTDFDGSSLPLVAFDLYNNTAPQKTLELQILSNNETPFSDRLQWVVGYYRVKGLADIGLAGFRIAPAVLQGVTDLAGLGQVSLVDTVFDVLESLPLANTPLDDGVTLHFGGAVGFESDSVYFQTTYFFNDWLDLTLGGRYQEETRFIEGARTALVYPTTGTADVNVLAFQRQSAKATNFSPKVVLSLHPRDDALLYASYSTGFKSGTYNIINIYRAPDYIVPEKVTTYELGAKVDFLDGRLRVNGAVFKNEIENLQSGFVSLFAGGVVSLQTAGAAETKGVEFDVSFLPIPDWNPGLALTANGAYVDAKYTDFKNGQGYNPATGLFTGGNDFTGNEIVKSPKLSGGVGIVQSIDVGDGTYELGVDGYYNSGFYYDSLNAVEEDAYSLLNARFGYLYNPWRVRVTAYGANLLNRVYHIQRFQTDFGVLDSRAAPREYGLRVNWDF